MSRRQMLLRSLRTGIALSIVGCTGHEETDTGFSHTRTQPKSLAKNHFDQLPCNESIIGKEFTVTATVRGIERDVRVHIKDLFSWEIDGEEFTLQTLSAEGSTLRSNEKIAGLNRTLEECLHDAVVAPEHAGIELHTSLGTAHISHTEVSKAVGTLAEIAPEFSGGYTVHVGIHAEPNDQGQILLIGGRVGNWIGLSSKEVNLPDSVSLNFHRDEITPPPTLTKTTPTETDEAPSSESEPSRTSSLLRRLRNIARK